MCFTKLNRIINFIVVFICVFSLVGYLFPFVSIQFQLPFLNDEPMNLGLTSIFSMFGNGGLDIDLGRLSSLEDIANNSRGFSEITASIAKVVCPYFICIPIFITVLICNIRKKAPNTCLVLSGIAVTLFVYAGMSLKGIVLQLENSLGLGSGIFAAIPISTDIFKISLECGFYITVVFAILTFILGWINIYINKKLFKV